ncbi:MAG: outer membrane protein assembly factor BamC [Methylovulum sp.]|nr:outer membrane protein assembly factor BamC [Methylovulum sp.]
MKVIVKGFFLSIALSACGGDDPRYRSTEMLERPPVLVTHKSTTEPVVLEDDSVIPKRKHKKGLQDDVYLTPSKPPIINIKQPYDMAWDTLKLALTQSQIKVTDQVRDKGLFFVSYNPKSLVGMVTSLVNKEEKEVIYVVTVDKNAQETRVSIKKATEAEQKNSLEQRAMDQEADDDADALLYQLYETLHDDLMMI